jgi:hypothetical protein
VGRRIFVQTFHQGIKKREEKNKKEKTTQARRQEQMQL